MTTRATILQLMHKVTDIIEPGACILPAHLPPGLARARDAEFLVMTIRVACEWLEDYPVFRSDPLGWTLFGLVVCVFVGSLCIAPGFLDAQLLCGAAGFLVAWIVGDTAWRLSRKLRVARIVKEMERAFDQVRLVDAA